MRNSVRASLFRSPTGVQHTPGISSSQQQIVSQSQKPMSDHKAMSLEWWFHPTSEKRVHIVSEDHLELRNAAIRFGGWGCGKSFSSPGDESYVKNVLSHQAGRKLADCPSPWVKIKKASLYRPCRSDLSADSLAPLSLTDRERDGRKRRAWVMAKAISAGDCGKVRPEVGIGA